MTTYVLIAIGVFLVFCALLHTFRTNLIVDHRAKARTLLIKYNGDNFWDTVQVFNSCGSFEQQHNAWHKWTFEDFYGRVLVDHSDTGHFLGVY